MKTIITDIPDYHTFIKGEKTVEIGYPWLSFGAILAIEKILDDSNGEFRILEMGCGGSTVFFSKRCKEVFTLEHSRAWADRVLDRIDTKGDTASHTSNVFMICNPHELLLNYLRQRKDENYDLILADGGSNYKERQELLFASASKLKKGGWMVIDNYEKMTFDYTGYEVYTFDMFRYSGKGTRLCKKL